MPANKKHHYVPRVYLKNFSSNEKTINLYNLSRDIVIREGKLKSQCYRDYLYGEEDKLEKALGLVENQAAKLFRKIRRELKPPQAESNDFVNFLMFVIYQRSRTLYAARAINEMLVAMAKKFISYRPDVPEDIFDKITIKVNEPAIHALRAANHSLHFALDLSCKLLLAKKGTEFITSDNPVVFYNQALEGCHSHQGIGTASKGLQIFFPISPEISILFYDASIYKVGGRREQTIQITEQHDMDQINILMLANAEENIYFLTSDRINLREIKQGKRFRIENTGKLHTLPGKRTEQEHSDILIHQGIRPKTGLRLSFLKELATAVELKFLVNSGHLRNPGLLRDPALVTWDKRWQESVESGNQQNFFEFIASQ
ncbi:hypothetical protein CRN80_21570 [Pseudomonas sp. FDAARGOS_380]|uniref:DUF4238 domain-containing protein n=1 Tax=Pseudomonas sp. FDAARGOS_380 TaxID=2018067 RepID=UPI000BFD38DA|nr:DUF4238 domain-containing protein [Pseudomonas sp. FDAARGOS_380]ATN12056.1 hypothetical protein CRN80_21570 [Pseudomonas sp. FDAARGOS_380]